MSVFGDIKNRVQNIRENAKGHQKWKMFLYAGIMILLLGIVWLTQTNQG